VFDQDWRVGIVVTTPKKVLLLVIMFLFVTVLTLTVITAVPARDAARAIRLTNTVTAGVTTLDEFRKTLETDRSGSLTCNGGNCYYSFVTYTGIASRSGLAHPGSLSIETWFENSVATRTQVLFMVGEFGQYAFVNVVDQPETLKCVSPCASRTKSGLIIGLDRNTPPNMRVRALDLNTNCLWFKFGCRNLEAAYPSAPIFLELARQRTLRDANGVVGKTN
jgi:hypothetical protein